MLDRNNANSVNALNQLQIPRHFLILLATAQLRLRTAASAMACTYTTERDQWHVNWFKEKSFNICRAFHSKNSPATNISADIKRL